MKAYRPIPPDLRRAALEAGLAAYERGDFFEAHELLEPAWMGTSNLAERALYQGLIKLAAGYVHAVRGNPIGVDQEPRGRPRAPRDLAAARSRAGSRGRDRPARCCSRRSTLVSRPWRPRPGKGGLKGSSSICLRPRPDPMTRATRPRRPPARRSRPDATESRGAESGHGHRGGDQAAQLVGARERVVEPVEQLQKVQEIDQSRQARQPPVGSRRRLGRQRRRRRQIRPGGRPRRAGTWRSRSACSRRRRTPSRARRSLPGGRAQVRVAPSPGAGPVGTGPKPGAARRAPSALRRHAHEQVPGLVVGVNEDRLRPDRIDGTRIRFDGRRTPADSSRPEALLGGAREGRQHRRSPGRHRAIDAHREVEEARAPESASNGPGPARNRRPRQVPGQWRRRRRREPRAAADP